MENHHCSWENQLFLWPFSIANCKRLPEDICIPDLPDSIPPQMSHMSHISPSRPHFWTWTHGYSLVLTQIPIVIPHYISYYIPIIYIYIYPTISHILIEKMGYNGDILGIYWGYIQTWEDPHVLPILLLSRSGPSTPGRSLRRPCRRLPGKIRSTDVWTQTQHTHMYIYIYTYQTNACVYIIIYIEYMIICIYIYSYIVYSVYRTKRKTHTHTLQSCIYIYYNSSNEQMQTQTHVCVCPFFGLNVLFFSTTKSKPCWEQLPRGRTGICFVVRK